MKRLFDVVERNELGARVSVQCRHEQRLCEGVAAFGNIVRSILALRSHSVPVVSPEVCLASSRSKTSEYRLNVLIVNCNHQSERNAGGQQLNLTLEDGQHLVGRCESKDRERGGVGVSTPSLVSLCDDP